MADLVAASQFRLAAHELVDVIDQDRYEPGIAGDISRRLARFAAAPSERIAADIARRLIESARLKKADDFVPPIARANEVKLLRNILTSALNVIAAS